MDEEEEEEVAVRGESAGGKRAEGDARDLLSFREGQTHRAHDFGDADGGGPRDAHSAVNQRGGTVGSALVCVGCQLDIKMPRTTRLRHPYR